MCIIKEWEFIPESVVVNFTVQPLIMSICLAFIFIGVNKKKTELGEDYRSFLT